MTLLAPAFGGGPAAEAVGDWHPARFTPSLSGTEDFPSAGDALLRLVRVHWRSPETDEFVLDDWQQWLIRHVLEVYPDDWPVERLRGKLRFRQVVISLGRQNGKSVIAAILALFFLAMHVRGPRVLGMASDKDVQARVVYDRLKYAIEANPALFRELRPTETRGIHKRATPHPIGLDLDAMRKRDRGAAGLSAGIYQLVAADEGAAQGQPVTGALADELHLLIAALWDAIVKGQESKENSMVAGITTAGDDDSHLLIRLYADGEEALAGNDERFGFFVWEGADDELTEANVIAANPAVACGRIDLDTVMAGARKLWRAPADETGVTGRDRVIRYTLNRFVAGSADSWASIAAWNDGAAEDVEIKADTGAVVYSLDRADGWEWASIHATTSADRISTTELVASIPAPDAATLVEACELLAKRGPAVFVVDRKTLAEVGKSLVAKGYEVRALTEAETAAAAATAKAAIARRAVVHPGDALTRSQMPKAKRRNTSEGWRISRTLSTGDIDAVMSMAFGVYVASTMADRGHQIF
jgi:phage terminase large subunit-like protein